MCGDAFIKHRMNARAPQRLRLDVSIHGQGLCRSRASFWVNTLPGAHIGSRLQPLQVARDLTGGQHVHPSSRLFTFLNLKLLMIGWR